LHREDRAARAAFWLAALLFAGSWGASLERPLPACREPAEAASRRGATERVRCDGAGPPLRGPARLLFGGRLDPNAASAASLTVLPGIGPVRAAAIVAERERAAFGSVAELRRVRGIGPVTLARIAPWLEVGGGGGERRRAPLQQSR
jgi:hypothetical protein